MQKTLKINIYEYGMYEGGEHMYKVVLWGLGQGYNVFVSNHGLEMVDVVAIADKIRGGVCKKYRWHTCYNT